jgi:hypothetical protein
MTLGAAPNYQHQPLDHCHHSAGHGGLGALNLDPYELTRACGQRVSSEAPTIGAADSPPMASSSSPAAPAAAVTQTDYTDNDNNNNSNNSGSTNNNINSADGQFKQADGLDTVGMLLATTTTLPGPNEHKLDEQPQETQQVQSSQSQVLEEFKMETVDEQQDGELFGFDESKRMHARTSHQIKSEQAISGCDSSGPDAKRRLELRSPLSSHEFADNQPRSSSAVAPNNQTATPPPPQQQQAQPQPPKSDPNDNVCHQCNKPITDRYLMKLYNSRRPASKRQEQQQQLAGRRRSSALAAKQLQQQGRLPASIDDADAEADDENCSRSSLVFHENCLKCSICDRLLDKSCFVRNSKLYCPQDYYR